MIADTLLTQGAEYVSQASAHVGDVRGWIDIGQQYIQNQFGTNGVIAAYVLSGALGIAVFSKLVRVGFAALIYLVAPALLLAWIGSLFLPYDFSFLLPITTATCSLVFLFKA